MKSHRTTLLKSFAIAIALLSVMLLGQSQARADEVTISGFTTGAVSGVPQLTFAGYTNFTNTTFLGIGAPSGAINLGTFFLGTPPGHSVPRNFAINAPFTYPSGTNAAT